MTGRKQSQRHRYHSCGYGEIHSEWTLVTGKEGLGGAEELLEVRSLTRPVQYIR